MLKPSIIFVSEICLEFFGLFGTCSFYPCSSILCSKKTSFSTSATWFLSRSLTCHFQGIKKNVNDIFLRLAPMKFTDGGMQGASTIDLTVDPSFLFGLSKQANAKTAQKEGRLM